MEEIRIKITNVPKFKIADFAKFIMQRRNINYYDFYSTLSTAYLFELFIEYTKTLEQDSQIQEIYLDALSNDLRGFLLTKM